MAHSSKYGNVTVQDDSLMNPLNDTDEPVFILRARDTASLSVLTAYIEDVDTRGAGDDFVEEVQKVYDTFQKWQDEHRDEIKLPD